MTEWTTRTTEPTGDLVGRVLILPGRGYTADHPLLFEPTFLARDLGWRVHALEWSPTGDDLDRAPQYVEEAADRLLADAAEAPHTVVVGKSLGTLGAGWANRHGFPGVWLTPLFDELGPHVDALTVDGPPALVVGGTADPMWDATVAARTRARIVEIAGADHALRVPGDWRASVAALTTTLESIEGLLHRVAGR